MALLAAFMRVRPFFTNLFGMYDLDFLFFSLSLPCSMAWSLNNKPICSKIGSIVLSTHENPLFVCVLCASCSVQCAVRHYHFCNKLSISYTLWFVVWCPTEYSRAILIHYYSLFISVVAFISFLLPKIIHWFFCYAVLFFFSRSVRYSRCGCLWLHSTASFQH